jgi:hypothetical protein
VPSLRLLRRPRGGGDTLGEGLTTEGWRGGRAV